jgi:Flp pilus assembly protein TadG
MRRLRRDRGAVTALELVLVAPVFLGVLVFVVLCGRMGRATHAVRSVAAAAARAASVERSHGAAVAAAAAVIRPADGDLTCAAPDVSFTADADVETVTVRVRCEASLAGLSLLPIGGTRTFESTATEVIDAYRGE